MKENIWSNVLKTRIFFLIRFMFSLLIGMLYILISAFLQNFFVSTFGETTYNYIVGGLLSLFVGAIFCKYIGNLLFMFAKGWHVAALAYLPKIEEHKASVFDVGFRIFKKNLVSFGAVYGARTLLKSIYSEFKENLWDLVEGTPYISGLSKVADHPIVQHFAEDLLHYSFDASIFYLVRHSPKDINEIPKTLLTALKKYLYCLPKILMSSITTYILFRFLPAVLKLVIIILMFLNNGIVAGILITVLMYPIFYILDNTFFEPLTMMVFLSVYADSCEQDDENSAIVEAVDKVLKGSAIGTTAEKFKDVEENTKEDRSDKDNFVVNQRYAEPEVSGVNKGRMLTKEDLRKPTTNTPSKPKYTEDNKDKDNDDNDLLAMKEELEGSAFIPDNFEDFKMVDVEVPKFNHQDSGSTQHDSETIKNNDLDRIANIFNTSLFDPESGALSSLMGDDYD